MYFRFFIVFSALIISTAGNMVKASPYVVISSKDVSCPAGNTGEIKITLANIPDEYTISIEAKTQNTTKYFRNMGDNTFTHSNLQADKYLIKINTGNSIIKDTIININEPDPFYPNKILPVKSPSSESAKDGIILASARGGSKPYIFQWDEKTGSQTSDTARNLAYGVYTCTVTDASECKGNSKHITIFFFEEAINNQDKQ